VVDEDEEMWRIKELTERTRIITKNQTGFYFFINRAVELKPNVYYYLCSPRGII